VNPTCQSSSRTTQPRKTPARRGRSRHHPAYQAPTFGRFSKPTPCRSCRQAPRGSRSPPRWLARRRHELAAPEAPLQHAVEAPVSFP
jgi:hypothetical protein